MYQFEARSYVGREVGIRSKLLLLLSILLIVPLSGCVGVMFKGSGSLSGTPSSASAILTGISCGTQSLVGSQSKSCSVSLSGVTKSNITVLLKSNSKALQVPASVQIPTGASSATFNIVSSAVNQSVSVTITASALGGSKTAGITVYPPAIATPSLTSVSCGTQSLTGPATETCSVFLSTAASASTVVLLQSNTASLTVPPSTTVTSGNSTASFHATVLAVNSSVTATITASLNGVSVSSALQLLAAGGSTTATQHTVNLNWMPPTSATDLAGYHVYRSFAGSSSFQLLNSSLAPQTTYADASVLAGQSYDYQVRSVNSTGAESDPSNIATVTIP